MCLNIECRWLCINLVPRVSPLPAPWSERRETLVWSGHVPFDN